MKPNVHILYTPFTGVGLHGGFRGNTWFKHRISIFKNYTLKSLANQTNRNFLLWLSFRAEEESNPLIHEIAKELHLAGVPYIFTFHGLMYHDDRFSNYDLKTKVRNFAQMVYDGYKTKEMKPLSEIWKYTWEHKNKTLPYRLAQSISQIKDHIGSEYDWVYVTRIDSDDMFNKQAIELIQQQEPEVRKALSFQEGYMYNVETGQLGEWLPPTNPPFHTIIFPAETFFYPTEHLAYYRDFRSHEDIPRVFFTTQLDMNQYCVTAHGKDHISTSWDVPTAKRVYQEVKYRGYSHTTSGKNISTRWESRLTKQKNHMLGKEFTDPEEKKAILEQFGL